MRADVGIRVLLRPVIEQLSEGRTLRASGRKTLLPHEDEDDIPFRGEVRDVLGDHRPPVPTSAISDLAVIGTLESDLGHVERIVSVRIAEDLRGGLRIHLVEEKPHRRSDPRCSVSARLALASSSLRRIRVAIGSGCAAA